jgi:TonB family protein
MSETWKQWSGQVVDGKFKLSRYLGGSEHSAVFLTERAEGGRSLPAAIKLIPSAPESDQRVMARWRLAAQMTHPHLLPVYETGRCEIDHLALLYVVMQYAEESLAEVLAGRALAPGEAQAALGPTLDVLAYLHDKGLVHGHIKPTNIMAIGDELKLSSDALRSAGEPCDSPDRPDAYDPPECARRVIPLAEGMSPAADIWSLGATLVEMLTQSLPAAPPPGSGELSLPELPEPFADIARHCLLRNPKNRWTVAQIGARLRNEPAIASPALVPPSEPEVRAPASPAQTQRAVQQRQQVRRAKRPSYAIPVAVGLVFLAALTIPKLFRHPPEAPQIPAVSSERQTAPAQPEEQTPPAPHGQPVIVSRPSGPITAEKRQDSAGGAPLPASVQPATPYEAAPKAEAKLPAGTIVPGTLAQQISPDVLPGARSTIEGTVRVIVRVDVDPSGSVEAAELASPAASKYFARVALQAAQRAKFTPPKVAGRNVTSTWNLQFDFTRDDTTVTPTQKMP